MILRSDADGRINARIHGSKVEAGDNYRLRVSLYRPVAATDPCSANDRTRPCFESEIFTIWKRFVVEKDRMFRSGTFLAEDYVDGLTVRVVPHRRFRPAAGAVVMFIRPGSEAVRSELRTIVRYRRGVITLDAPLDGTYEGIPDGSPQHLADAVGIVGEGTYDVTLGPLSSELEHAYIDVQERSQPVPYFPFMHQIRLEQEMIDLSNRWRQGDADVHLIAARYLLRPDRSTAFGTQTEDMSYVWTQQCIDFTNEADPFRNEVAAHEVIHRWDVNVGVGRTGDHCDLDAWSDSARRCTMHTYVQEDPDRAGSPVRPEFRDGRIEFHYVLQFNGPDSEYLMLRSRGGVQ